jgi:inner membrane protein YidH
MSEKWPPDPNVYFAAERTYLAWIRAGLALMGFGFVLACFALLGHQLRSMGSNRLPAEAPDLSHYFGIALVMVGVLTTAAAAVSHVRTVHGLNAGEPFVSRPTWVGILIAVLLAAVGTLMSVYLFRS